MVERTVSKIQPVFSTHHLPLLRGRWGGEVGCETAALQQAWPVRHQPLGRRRRVGWHVASEEWLVTLTILLQPPPHVWGVGMQVVGGRTGLGPTL